MPTSMARTESEYKRAHVYGTRFGVHPSTITRWITRGVKKADGTIVFLAGLRAGGVWLVAESAMAEFTSALGEQRTGELDGVRSPAERRRASEHDGKILEAIGAG